MSILLSVVQFLISGLMRPKEWRIASGYLHFVPVTLRRGPWKANETKWENEPQMNG